MDWTHRFRERLAGASLRRSALEYSRESAVLIPIFEDGGELHFLLTRRTEEVRTHKGQISFPGGMRQGEESLQEAALRETFEEIGIPERGIEILGRFHDYHSINGFLVVPFAARLRMPFETSPQPGEVAEILSVPIHIFREPGRMRVEEMVRLGKKVDVYFYSYEGYEIWGLTARIIKDFLEEIHV